ncbi:TolC family protein [Nereida sp. MMG025]|uniref:TolC family protein n=1 Tax=Nereida sp. MMG025 TaxID=2909981 RepID=UPI001F00097E|nr:TolC family protein [Nereida sp. MMG025]MCF6444597.1 TolC family protein [Nereida sp. MMG025]
MNADPQATRGPMALLKPSVQSEDGTKTETAAEKQARESVIIQSLTQRKSILPSGSSFDRVAGSVMAASSRTAEAELRSAKLRAEARSKNWLPTLGPTISLNSLGSLVAGILIEQVLFDNGKKKAERAFAAADVEVAAVNLVVDTNERVLDGLELYIASEEAKRRAAVTRKGIARMERFEYIMGERVRGGVSNRADLQVIQQKLTQMRSDLSADQELSATAIAELNAMAADPVNGVSGLTSLGGVNASGDTLDVLKARAEKDRTIAEAVIARAGLLPGVSLTGSADSDGNSSAGLTLKTENGIGFGLRDNLAAVEAQKDMAERRVSQTREDSNRSLAKLKQTLISIERKRSQSQSILDQADANLALFEEQYEAGQRPVMDLIGVYETKINAERDHISHAYDIARTKLKIAKELGLLADGEEI